MTSKDRPPYASKLAHGHERFLAHVIEHGLFVGRRSPEDFIRHFPPAVIMEGLGNRPDLRSAILVVATGVRPKVAEKKTATSAGDDLQIALDEGETDAETIVTLFDADDRVRYLDREELWAYVTEGRFWEVEPSDAAGLDRAQKHVAYILERALADELITHRDVVEGITVQKLAELLPRPELERLLSSVLSNARRATAFTEVDVLATVPCTTIVRHVPLALIWARVVVPKIAESHGLAPKPPPPKPAVVEPEPAPAAAPVAEAAPAADVAPAATPPRASDGRPPTGRIVIPKPGGEATVAAFKVSKPGGESGGKRRSQRPKAAAPVGETETVSAAAVTDDDAEDLSADDVQVDVDSE